MALDDFRKVNITLNKANQRVLETQIAKVGDANGRELVVQITNNGIIEDQTGTTLKLNWQHENGKQGSTNFNVVDIKTGLFSVYYPTEMLYKGKVNASIEITSNGQITNSMNFKIIVQADVFDGEAGNVDGVFISLAEVNKKLDDREAEYVELKNRQTSVENQFDAIQQDLTNKDIVSAPEIIAARDGEATLSDRLDKDQQKVDAQLAQIVKLAPINNESVATSIQEFYATLEEGVTLKVPAGEYTLNEPLVFDRAIDLDFTGVTFNYAGSGTAITVGNDNAGIHSRRYVMPYVYRNTLNWNDDVDGIRVVNINTSTMYFNSVSKFRKGIIIDAQGYGNSYNDYHLKSVVNNLHSIVLTSNATGWSNENTYYGGRFGLTSDTRTAVTNENTHVLIEDNGYSQNNNVFSRASFESGAMKGVEHVAKIENGRMIYFRDCRYEGVYNVDITDGIDVQFTGGFGVNSLNFLNKKPNVLNSHVGVQLVKKLGFSYYASSSSNNDIANFYSGGSITPRFTIKGDGSLDTRGSIHFDRRMSWGSGPNPSTFYTGTTSPIDSLEANPGSIYVKYNTGQSFIKSWGTGIQGWVPQQRIRNSTTASRPSYDIVGEMLFDTTLNKPIWWSGENWVDATGSVV